MTRYQEVAVVVLLAAAGPSAGLYAQTHRSAYEELQTFSGVLNHIRLNYPDSLSYSELVAAAIRGVLRALDPHSYYVSRTEWQRRSALERGELVSVGIALEEVDGAATVLAVAPRSPAAKSGVFPGDRIVLLNDTSVAGLDMTTLELRLAGVVAATDSLLDKRLARILASRAAEVRWGPDAREEFLIRNDRTIRVAMEQFSGLYELLASPKAKE